MQAKMFRKDGWTFIDIGNIQELKDSSIRIFDHEIVQFSQLLSEIPNTNSSKMKIGNIEEQSLKNASEASYRVGLLTLEPTLIRQIYLQEDEKCFDEIIRLIIQNHFKGEIIFAREVTSQTLNYHDESCLHILEQILIVYEDNREKSITIRTQEM